MERKIISGITLHYDSSEIEAAGIISKACQKSVRTIKELWQLRPPDDCRVYILTSWPRCVFQGAALPTRILLVLTIPWWYADFKKRWKYAGGWSQNYGDRHIVGIKSPPLINITSQSMGESIFIHERNLEDKILSIVCHELTHAFSSHLALPAWLHEGVAMVSADYCLGRPTVKSDTLKLLRDSSHRQSSVVRINLHTQSQEDITSLYVRGYWITRYLVETQPNLIKGLLEMRRSHEEIEKIIAVTVGLVPDQLWMKINNIVANYFTQEMT